MIARAEDFQGSTHKLEYEGEPIKYFEQTPSDAVAQLQQRLIAGDVKLPFDNEFGYLPALLEELKIPRSSQNLVFSKTSLQRRFITPENPRALYFNDNVYIGYVPGAPALEVSAADPKLGGIFYRFENEKVRKPKFVRDADCLRCHGSNRTLGVPGHLMRSIGTDLTGELEPSTEINDIDHCTPFADRWAGWYVSGTHGGMTHRGNLVGLPDFERTKSEPNFAGNVTDLSRFLDLKKYVEPTSDIVALMVLEHQVHMHNYITRLNFETQRMMSMYGHIKYLKSQEDAFLRYLLMVEEAPLTAPVKGNSDFATEFSARGPCDAKGRSLREFNLETRLFKYPCSFLIYSDAFDSMPEIMRQRLLQRLRAILTNADPDPQFVALTADDRAAVLEILQDTLPEFARLADAQPPAGNPPSSAPGVATEAISNP
ncbi:MAG: hypothetical protein ABI680_06775 [Chthoniobacteraceae bacterium]